MNLHDLAGYRLCYLASPYSRYEPGIDRACDDVSEIAGRLMAAGVRLFCPVSHSHTIAMASGLDPLDHKLWMDMDEAIAAYCNALVVVELDGWRTSKGVGAEIAWFATRPKYFLNPVTMALRQ